MKYLLIVISLLSSMITLSANETEEKTKENAKKKENQNKLTATQQETTFVTKQITITADAKIFKNLADREPIRYAFD